MNERDFKNAILDADFANMGADRIAKETFIFSIIVLILTAGNTQNITTGIIFGIATFIITTILWRIPIVNKIMIFLFSFIWALCCGGFIAGFNITIGIIIGIITFFSSIALHIAWIFR